MTAPADFPLVRADLLSPVLRMPDVDGEVVDLDAIGSEVGDE